MNWTFVSLFFDVLMVMLLGVTIVFAARLSLSLKRFKDNRDILDKMIRDLNTNVQDAERVIKQLQNSARDTGSDLQRMIDQATSLSDELSLMTEAGDNLAGRLEKLAERNGQFAQQQNAAVFSQAGFDDEPVLAAPSSPSSPKRGTQGEYAEHLKHMAATPTAPERGKTGAKAAAKAPKTSPNFSPNGASVADEGESVFGRMFSIRDPDIERGTNPLADTLDGIEELDIADDLHSEAERDLYEALNAGRPQKK